MTTKNICPATLAEGYDGYSPIAIKYLFVFIIRRSTETNNHNMHRCLVACFVAPLKRSVCKINMNSKLFV